jgi:hypothetical protein
MIYGIKNQDIYLDMIYIGKKWYVNGKLHRDDKPAFIDQGNKEWYKNGQRHREVPPGECGSIRNDLPAIEWNDGSKEWFIDGKHREYNNYTTPCILHSDGTVQWFIDGQYIIDRYYRYSQYKE